MRVAVAVEVRKRVEVLVEVVVFVCIASNDEQADEIMEGNSRRADGNEAPLP